ncbi:hypothetical protein [Mesorhizobium mediterraneum]|uniref:hypothetical protein n=1 Tax=Mesorhizobium mediterraneum TaxID=43617 RepID=UPI00177FE480|nr:hypothetical protein [Mesorhizobium mediterraneum]
MINAVIGMITSTVSSITDTMIGIIIGNVGADIRRHDCRARHLDHDRRRRRSRS